MKARKPASEIAHTRSKAMMRRYDITENNCESSINDRISDNKYPAQVDSIQKVSYLRVSYIDLYISQIPTQLERCTLYPKSRQDEIDSCGSAKVRAEKQYVWQILGYALQRTCALNIRELDIYKTKTGKWVCSDVCFSLSHSKHYAAVAISGIPVGVDLEELPNERLNERLYRRIACDAELSSLGENPSQESIARLWTMKESIFKRGDAAVFNPKDLDTTCEAACCYRGDAFSSLMISLSTEETECVNCYHLTPTLRSNSGFEQTAVSILRI